MQNLPPLLWPASSQLWRVASSSLTTTNPGPLRWELSLASGPPGKTPSSSFWWPGEVETPVSPGAAGVRLGSGWHCASTSEGPDGVALQSAFLPPLSPSEVFGEEESWAARMRASAVQGQRNWPAFPDPGRGWKWQVWEGRASGV